MTCARVVFACPQGAREQEERIEERVGEGRGFFGVYVLAGGGKHFLLEAA